MNTKQILATVAVTGAVATFALLNVNSVQSGNTFLATPMTDAEHQFIQFVSEHHRSYGTKEEYAYRLSLFAEAVEKIKSHNAEVSTFKLGLNKFADMSNYEYKSMLGYKSDLKTASPLRVEGTTAAPVFADSIDWVAKGGVTPVKNQGSCGSCWAFSSTGSLEGAFFNAEGKLQSFSEQQLVDCSFLGGYGNLGCNGGLMDSAFSYVIKEGIELESDYPYTGKRATCTSDKFTVQGKITGFVDVKVNDSDALKEAVTKGPVSVAIEADKAAFQLYKGGIIQGDKCGVTLDHGVLVVGYGVDAGVEYFTVKNSWGPDWGESGYVRLGIEAGAGVCGVQSQASFPTI